MAKKTKTKKTKTDIAPVNDALRLYRGARRRARNDAVAKSGRLNELADRAIKEATDDNADDNTDDNI